MFEFAIYSFCQTIEGLNFTISLKRRFLLTVLPFFVSSFLLRKKYPTVKAEYLYPKHVVIKHIFSCPCIVSVPSKPPGDVKTTSDVGIIRVTWRHIPSDGVNGVLSGYKVFYRLSDNRGDEDNGEQYSAVAVGPTDLQASIEGLINSETYEIRVAGLTKVGVGVFSEAVYARPGDLQFLL